MSTAVKNRAHVPHTPDLRVLVNSKLSPDKKDGMEEFSCNFWDILNQVEGDEKAPPSQSSKPSKVSVRQEKQKLVPAVEDSKGEVTESATLENREGKQQALTGFVPVIQPEPRADKSNKLQPITVEMKNDQPIKVTLPQRVALERDDENVIKTDNAGDVILNGKNKEQPEVYIADHVMLDLKEAFVVRGPDSLPLEHKKEMIAPVSHNLQRALEGEDKRQIVHEGLINHQQSTVSGKEKTHHIEILSPPPDSTPLSVNKDILPSNGHKGVPVSVKEFMSRKEDQLVVEQGTNIKEEMSALKSPFYPKLAKDSPHESTDVRESRPIGQASSFPLLFSPTSLEKNDSLKTILGRDNGNLSIKPHVSLGGHKTIEQAGSALGQMPVKKITMAEKIQALTQIRSELKASLEKGETHLKIHLVPDDLGKIEIKVDIDQYGVARALFTTDQRDTMEYIAQYGQEFVHIFQESGLQTDLSSMNFQSRQQSRDDSHQQNHSESLTFQEKEPVRHRISMTQLDIEV